MFRDLIVLGWIANALEALVQQTGVFISQEAMNQLCLIIITTCLTGFFRAFWGMMFKNSYKNSIYHSKSRLGNFFFLT